MYQYIIWVTNFYQINNLQLRMWVNFGISVIQVLFYKNCTEVYYAPNYNMKNTSVEFVLFKFGSFVIYKYHNFNLFI